MSTISSVVTTQVGAFASDRTLSQEVHEYVANAWYVFAKKQAIAYMWSALLESLGILVLAKKLSKGVQKVLLLKLKVKLKLKQISSNGHGSTAKRLVCTTIILMLSIVYYAATYLSMHLHFGWWYFCLQSANLQCWRSLL
jgi:hypothetical protein